MARWWVETRQGGKGIGRGLERLTRLCRAIFQSRVQLLRVSPTTTTTRSRSRSRSWLARLAQFAIGWWAFIDAVIFSRLHDLPVEIKFEDWVPGLLSTLSLVMVNLIDKSALNATEFTHDGSYVAFKARLWAFLGVTMALVGVGEPWRACPRFLRFYAGEPWRAWPRFTSFLMVSVF